MKKKDTGFFLCEKKKEIIHLNFFFLQHNNTKTINSVNRLVVKNITPESTWQVRKEKKEAISYIKKMKF